MTLDRRTCLLAAPALVLTGCAAPDVTHYAAEQPTLLLEDYFNGKLLASGMFTDRSGKVVKRFTVAMNCTWQGNDGVLDEDFTYSDGTLQKRIWRVKKTGVGTYEGRADDVVGVAVGRASGNALHWTYTLALPVDGRTWNMAMDDWMFLMPGGTLLNRTAMSKFGIHLGDVTLAFRKT
ncbi:DUF3833 domain-containing protein [Ramlibacter sp.]|uniref:DUF3833 domain-containing protein n=1 Tax=Ramlibacter sp. TaxID=1917967 RepID=UPI003D0A4C96